MDLQERWPTDSIVKYIYLNARPKKNLNRIKQHISFVIKNDWSIKVSVDGATQYVTGTEDKNWKCIVSKKRTGIYKVGGVVGERNWTGLRE